MAESLVGKIVSNAGKQWNRNTVADGTWLNTNTVQKFNQNDKTLAEAIESVSAAMEHFTPEITPSAWPGAANKTIQTIEQNADGSLNVTYQPIETSTTSDDSLWSWYKHNAYDSVLAEYTEPEEDINHEAGELSNNLTIPPGIYDVKVEVLYEPTKSTINNKLDIAISKSTNIDDALYKTFILFDDTLLQNDVQSEWINGIIKLTESTTLKFLIKGESAQGKYKLNNIYINSIIGVKGDTGDSVEIESITPIEGGNTITFKWGTNTSGFNVMDGEDGVSPTVDVTPTTTGQRIVITDKQGDHEFNLTNGESGEDGKTPLLQIDATNAHWQYRYSTSENWQDIPNTLAASGTKGDNGYSPVVNITDITDGHNVTITDETHQSTPHSFDVKDGISPTVATTAIPSGNRVTFTYGEGGEQKYIDVFSGTPGTDGISPTVSTEPNPNAGGYDVTFHYGDDLSKTITVPSGVSGEDGTSVIVKNIREFNDIVGTHTKGGTEITLEWNEGQTVKTSAFSAFNGEKGQDGSGASYTFDTGITLSGDGSTTPIGVNTELIATQTWVEDQGYLTSVPESYATKTYVDTASAAALSQSESWVNQQNFVTSAGIEENKQYVLTTGGWTSAIKIQVDTTAPTVDDGILHIILDS